MSLKAKIDVFPFESYLLQDPSVASVMQAVVMGNKSGNVNNNTDIIISGGNNAMNNNNNSNNKRRDGGGNSNTTIIERRLKTPLEKLMSLKARCREEQCVHSVGGILLVHVHDHPHVLLLRHNNTKSSLSNNNNSNNNNNMMRSQQQQQQQQWVLPATNINNTAIFRLPGGRCRKGELAEVCLLRKLGRELLNEAKRPTTGGATASSSLNNNNNNIRNTEEETNEMIVEVGGAAAGVLTSNSTSSSSFRIGEVLARWYRPHFDPFMYPYIPPHVTESEITEVRTIFLVHLPPQMILTISHPEVQLVAAPLFDLYENTEKYGALIASIPTLLSRVNVNYCR